MPVNKPITMRDLQKISASTIRAMPHSRSIKSRGETVGVLVPLRNTRDPAYRAQLDSVREAGEAFDASRTPKQRSAIDAYFAELDRD